MKMLIAALAIFLGLPVAAEPPPPKFKPPPPWVNAPPASIEVPEGAYKTAPARTALAAILKRGVGVALAQTARGDAFAPLAVVVDNSGKDQLVLSEAHVQTAGVEVDLMAQRDSLLNNAKKLKPTAVAVFADATVRLSATSGKVEAIVVNYQHNDGTCLTVVVPYDRTGDAVKPRAALATGGDCSESLLK